jgi:thymidylate synthase (FAD)
MRIIEPYVEVEKFDGVALMKKLEAAGRNCWKSEGKATGTSYETFLPNLIKRGHESPLEHVSLTFRFVVDRGVSHELVRHRIGAYSQESTRYCRYEDQIMVIKPFFFPHLSPEWESWWRGCRHAEMEYLALLEMGRKPQEARSVLPNSLKTDIIATWNIRELRHVFEQRCAPGAHPQMRQVMIPLLHYMRTKMFPLFHQVWYDANFPEEHYAEIKEVDTIALVDG